MMRLPNSSTSLDFRFLFQRKTGKIIFPKGIPRKAKTDRLISRIESASDFLVCSMLLNWS